MRHPEPQRMIDYRTAPEFCHTCEHYDQEGICKIHQSEPPEEFAATEKACDQWQMEIPF